MRLLLHRHERSHPAASRKSSPYSTHSLDSFSRSRPGGFACMTRYLISQAKAISAHAASLPNTWTRGQGLKALCSTRPRRHGEFVPRMRRCLHWPQISWHVGTTASHFWSLSPHICGGCGNFSLGQVNTMAGHRPTHIVLEVRCCGVQYLVSGLASLHHRLISRPMHYYSIPTVSRTPLSISSSCPTTPPLPTIMAPPIPPSTYHHGPTNSTLFQTFSQHPLSCPPVPLDVNQGPLSDTFGYPPAHSWIPLFLW